ncbi:MAG: RnfABCDGE type electron transport complex subunit D [Treponema sp.]|nr:RnfABCDGE type electron transport complex subunit D [Treponema sp.]
MSDTEKPDARSGEKNPAQPFLFISSSPHTGSSIDTRKLMGRVLISLTPVTIFGILLYGLPALLTIIVAICSASIAEALFRKAIKRDIRNKDLSAIVTGLIFALILPPSAPVWVTALGAAFGIIVAKEFFGGLGANVFNPALIGRAFIVISFPVAATNWSIPRAFFTPETGIARNATGFIADVISGATPLNIIKLEGSIPDISAGFSALGLAPGNDYWSTILSLFLGTHGGTIGESSVLLILIGFIYLFFTGTIRWRGPVFMILSVFVFSFLFGQDPLFAILSGGVFFGAVFMTTDYVTGPLSSLGKMIFGVCAGLITVLIRQLGNYPEGVMFGILIMNAVTPFINRFIKRRYGYVKPGKSGGGKN